MCPTRVTPSEEDKLALELAIDEDATLAVPFAAAPLLEDDIDDADDDELAAALEGPEPPAGPLFLPSGAARTNDWMHTEPTSSK